MTWDQIAVRRTELERVTPFKTIPLFCVCILVHTCHDTHVEVKGQLGNVYFFPVWVLGIELKLSGLATSALTH